MSHPANERSTKKSTNGRIVPGIIRAASLIAPELTARWAERAFLTPGRKLSEVAELAALDDGHPFRVPFAGGHLAAWSWGEGPTVFLVHGWGFSAARMAPLVQPLLANGFSVVAFDAPGHGLSDGKTSSIIEMAAALRAVVQWTAAGDGGNHAGAIGHSIGGAAIALAMKQGTRFRRAVFIGSPSSLEVSSQESAAQLGLTPRVVARMQERIETRFGMKWRDISVEQFITEPAVPLLLIHDVGDLAVPVEESARIAAVWPGAERILTEGLGHNRILQDAEVVARAAAFIAAGPIHPPVRPRTSGSQKRTVEREGRPVQSL